MDHREQLQQRMLEMIYGLLSDEESRELAQQISSDRDAARMYAELKERTDLLTVVTKVEPPQPADFDSWKKKAKQHEVAPAMRSLPASHLVRSLITLAACLLVGAVGFSWWAGQYSVKTVAYQQLESDLRDQFHVVSVIGPAQMTPNLTNTFMARVQDSDGQPVEADVEYRFENDRGQTVYFGKSQSVGGFLKCPIAADEVNSASQLKITAIRGKKVSEIDLSVEALPEQEVAVLQADRYVAEPGDRIQLRAVTLKQPTNQDASAAVDFVWKEDDRAESLSRERTLWSVATANASVPKDAPIGPQQVALELNSIRQTAKPLMVLDRSKNVDEYAFSYGLPDSSSTNQFAPKDWLYRAEVAPEGGQLVPGLQNRMYFRGRFSQQLQRNLDAKLIDSKKQVVAQQQSQGFGNGWFDFVPKPQESYQVQIEEQQSKQIDELTVEPVATPATFHVVNSIDHANQPLQVDINAAQGDTNLAVVVANQHATIGYHYLNTGLNAPVRMPVEIPLSEEAAGAQRVSLYELSENPTGRPESKLLGERIIYRIPVQRFDIAIDGLPEEVAGGTPRTVRFQVTNEFGDPQLATLGIQMHRVADTNFVSKKPSGLDAEFLLHQNVDLGAPWEILPEQLSELENNPPEFDTLLATSKWRIQDATDETPKLPILRLSNRDAVMMELNQAVDQLWSAVEENRDRFTQLSGYLWFTGGILLAFCMIGTAIMDGLPRIGMWGTGLALALVAVVWGLGQAGFSLTDRIQIDQIAVRDDVRSVALMPETQRVDELNMKATEQSVSETPILDRATSEQAIKPLATTMPQDAPYGAGSNAAPQAMKQNETEVEPSTEPIVWEPRVRTNADGEALLVLTLPREPGRYRLMVDAHGGGRLGSKVQYVDVAARPAVMRRAKSGINDAAE